MAYNHSERGEIMETPEQEALNDLARIFPTMTCGEVQTLKQKLIDAKTLYEPRKTQKVRELLPRLERIKKQSVLFGYPLVSDVISHFEGIIHKSDSLSEAKMTLLHNDILLLQEILWKKIRGDGGEKGRKILNMLKRGAK